MCTQLHSKAMGDKGAGVRAGSRVIPDRVERGHHCIRDQS